MKRAAIALVAIAVVFAVLPALAQSDVTTAWPYGRITWIDGKPNDATVVTNEITTAVHDVFSFWGLPVPTPGPHWADAAQTNSDIASSSSPAYVAAQPKWNGDRVLPLIIDFYPNVETMYLAWDDFSFRGSFAYPPSSTKPKALPSNLSLVYPLWTPPPDVVYSVFEFHMYDLISIAREPDWQRVLRHEIAHWLFSMWCQQHGLKFDSFPKLITEGFADYTRHSLSNEPDRWRRVAAVWAQHGGLADTPPALAYDVGTSLVAYLVDWDGKQGFLAELPQLAVDWNAQAKALTPGWRKWLGTVAVSPGDRALYEARLERLYTCALLLDPVLPQQAWDLVHRVDAGEGTMDDIDQFWHIVRTGLIKPRIDGWNDLIRRQDTLIFAGIHDGDDNATLKQIGDLETKLKAAWYHWDEYRPLYITGLIEVIARWGHVPQDSK